MTDVHAHVIYVSVMSNFYLLLMGIYHIQLHDFSSLSILKCCFQWFLIIYVIECLPWLLVLFILFVGFLIYINYLDCFPGVSMEMWSEYLTGNREVQNLILKPLSRKNPLSKVDGQFKHPLFDIFSNNKSTKLQFNLLIPHTFTIHILKWSV